MVQLTKGGDRSIGEVSRSLQGPAEHKSFVPPVNPQCDRGRHNGNVGDHKEARQVISPIRSRTLPGCSAKLLQVELENCCNWTLCVQNVISSGDFNGAV